MTFPGWYEPEVMYAHYFSMDPSYSSDDKKTMYTIASKVNAIPPLGYRLYRYVVIPTDFWVGDENPGTRLLTDEELYDTLKIQHSRRWKHVGYRSETEPHILLFQFDNDPPQKVKPVYNSEEEKRAAREEAYRKKAIRKEEERKRQEPLEIYQRRELRIEEELEKLKPNSFPSSKVPYRRVDEIGSLVVPYPYKPLKKRPPKLPSLEQPLQLNHIEQEIIHAEGCPVGKLKKSLLKRIEETSRDKTRRDETSPDETALLDRVETSGDETRRDETSREETGQDETSRNETTKRGKKPVSGELHSCKLCQH